MRTKIILAACILLTGCFLSNAQNINNGGFETWTGSPTHPTSWSCTSSVIGFPSDCVTKDTAALNHVEGLSAAKLKTDSINAGSFGSFLSEGDLYYGGGVFVTSPQPNTIFYGTPFTGRPDSIKFAYKFSPVSGDSGAFNIRLSYWNGSSEQKIGDYHTLFINANSNWAYNSSAINYSSVQTPDTIVLDFHTSYSYSQHVGTTLWVDEVKLVYNGASDINELKLSTEVSLSPNPVSAILYVAGNGIIDGAKVGIYDITGRLMASTELQNNAVDVSKLANGNYLIMVYDISGKELKGRFVVAK